MYARRTDANQAAIVKALRQIGATVHSLHTVGGGCPDLLCGYRGENYLLEIKRGDKPKSASQLNDAQVGWHDEWRGKAFVVRDVNEALQAIGAAMK